MNRQELRETVAGHLAAKGYIPEQFAWHPRLARIDIVVGESLLSLRFTCRMSSVARASAFARIPRRGPARSIARRPEEKAERQYDMLEYLGGEGRR